jgi:hypothetical protein
MLSLTNFTVIGRHYKSTLFSKENSEPFLFSSDIYVRDV